MRIRSLLALLLVAALCLGLCGCAFFSAVFGGLAATERSEEWDDVSEYGTLFGPDADRPEAKQFREVLDESIFPAEITAEMTVREFRLFYHNSMDPVYTGCLTVEYPEEAYAAELSRLAAFPKADWLGVYGAKDFADPADPLAMSTDGESGFVYAIHTPDRDRTITYVLMEFPDFFLTEEELAVIPAEYRPEGLSVLPDNEHYKAHFRDNP